MRGHHLTGELSFKNTWNPYQLNPKGMVLFSRGEMDQTCTKALYSINPGIGFYWGLLSGLNTGLSVHDQSANATDLALVDPEIMSSLLFFNKYAGQIYPATATAAYSVFHQGLNSSNSTIFPRKTYGQVSQSNVTRYKNICLAFKDQGARLDDTLAVTEGQVYQRDKQTGYNDAGWDIEEGNYERWITQIKADSTSMGLFRVRGAITAASSKYDRFARSFQYSKGKNTMYFQFHSELFSATNQPKSLKFSITWLDSIAGSKWELRYKDNSGTLQSPLKITGIGDRKWKTVAATITDMNVTHTGTFGSDFMLVNTDNLDDIFNGVEVDIERMSTGITKGIDDLKILFPNPVKSILNWNSCSDFDILQIYSLSGLLLNQYKTLSTKSVDLSYLSQGLYICRLLKANQVVQFQKLIKE